jgi:DNA-binding transcriptional MerR regulator
VSLRINEVAQAAGVNRETLRYYERRGLLDQPDRSPGGHRLYDERAVQTLRIIKAAQRLGFTLDEVAYLIEVGRRRGRDSGLQARAHAKLLEVEERMADLAAIRNNLRAALDADCDDLHQCASSDCCPLPFVEITTRKADGVSAKITDRHLFGAGAAACAVCCAPPLLALLGIAGVGALANVATIAFAGLAFGLVVLGASLLGI